MQKARKEEIRKHAAARDGKSAKEIRELDKADRAKAKLEALAKRLHEEIFPEEYDFMYDSTADAIDRRHGKDPMSADYIQRVTARRAAMGIAPLGADGTPTNNESWMYALAQAEAKLSRRKNA